jgi:quercetin dioxygenase-like cupin family protein
LIHVKVPAVPPSYLADMNERPLIDSRSAGTVSLPAETQFAENGIVSRTLLRTPTVRVVLFGFAEGQELTEHTSTQEALVQILSGQCEFVLDGEPRQLKTGDLVFMPTNLPHSVRATESFSMLLTLSKPESRREKQTKAGAASVVGV